MKNLGAIIFLLSSQFIFAQKNDLIQLRETCFRAFVENDPAEFLKRINQPNQINSPILTAYKSIAILFEAKRAFSPFEKIKIFNTGRNLLEYSIYTDKSNLELRFLRFCVQTNLPFILGYSKNIKGDKEFILKNWNYLEDKDLKERIKISMINSTYCSEIEKKKFSDG